MQSGSKIINEAALDRLGELLRTYSPALVLTGAGCSTESGIPDYRDRRGGWKHAQPVQWRDFLHDPAARRRFWIRSLAGWPRVDGALPNAAHFALARLEAAGVVHCVVTQNVDRLHHKAGQRHVIELHGRVDAVECLVCGSRRSRAHMQRALLALNPSATANSDASTGPDGDVLHAVMDSGDFKVPDCQHCGGLLKPAVVFFGDSVPRRRVEAAFSALQRARMLLVAGSSLMVFSGFRFCRAALQQRKPVAAVNLGLTRADDSLALKLNAPCGAALSGLAARLEA